MDSGVRRECCKLNITGRSRLRSTSYWGASGFIVVLEVLGVLHVEVEERFGQHVRISLAL